MNTIQSQASSLLDCYYRRLINHINEYGFCGEFIEETYKPDLDETRLLCQCRSIFFLLEYGKINSDLSLVEKAFDLYVVIQEHYFNEVNQTWSQYPRQSENTLYEYSFLLLALTKLYDAKPIDSIKFAINRIDQIIREDFIGIDYKFFNLKDSDGRICQNALMHLFEAYLETYKVFKTDFYLETVEVLLNNLMNLFYSSNFDLISEYYPIDNDNGEFEPGHSFEWAALLFETDTLKITIPAITNHQIIAESAESKGLVDNQLVVAKLYASGEVDTSRYRIWPLFERLRYYLMTNNQDKVQSIFEPFIELFFSKGFPIEYVNSEKKPDFNHIKATTAYHLINCFKFIFK